MTKKIFALAAVSALFGVVTASVASGCSSTNTITDPGDAADGATDAFMKKEVLPEPVEDAAGGTCPTAAAIDTSQSPWKPPVVANGVCTEADVVTLVKAIDANANIAYKDLKAKITSAECKACLFTPDGAKWGAFVEDSKGDFMRHNFGGCVAKLSGKEACGKAWSQYEDCIDEACKDCADDAAFTKCSTPATKGACKASGAAVQTICGDLISSVDDCQALSDKYLFESAARSLCVGKGDGGITDAGEDADSGM